MRKTLILATAVLLAACGGGKPSADELVVYSSRNDQLIKPLFDRYEAERGVRIRYLTDSDAALIARLEAEGEQSPADVLMTVDAGNLWQASQLGLLQPMDSDRIREAIPAAYRDDALRWTGLSLRARTIVYATERVDPEALGSYADLADERWRGRLCLRTSKKVYNQSLVAMMIARDGVETVESVVRGWVDNLATEPFANDTALIEAIAAGQCDVGIVNTYYFGRLQEKRPELPVALHWADQGEGEAGVHVNVSGAGVTASSARPQAAQALIEWLAQGEAQALFASLNKEYPANPAVPPAPEVAAWGDFRADTLPLSNAGRLQAEAVKLMDRAGYR